MKRKFLRCTSLVNPNAVTRKTINGIEHIIVSSFTLPSDVVMNGILYPASEIDSTFKGLNRTLAPVEHPTNSGGQFVSANDPEAIHEFHAGAFNDNAEKVGNRIKLDKIINVQEALKTDKGKRLLDRIKEIETSADAKPIHTSTGIFLEIEATDKIETSANGDEYNGIARNMVFDHDAILLDSVGAAQPDQGVGMAVNSSGQTADVETINLDIKDSRINQVGLSHRNLIDQLDTLSSSDAFEWSFVVDVFDDVFIIDTDKGYFEIAYSVSDEKARITGIITPVDRVVSYELKTNEGIKVMKDKIVTVLKAAGVKTDDLDDDALLTAYNKLHTSAEPATPAEPAPATPAAPVVEIDPIVNAMTEALKPLQEQMTALQDRVTNDDKATKDNLVAKIMASKKYPMLDELTLNELPQGTLTDIAAKCGGSIGLPFAINADADAANTAPVEMPK